MFGMNFLQAVLIILLAAFKAVDLFGPQTMVLGWSHVGMGFLTGLILGKPQLGLEIGANKADKILAQIPQRAYVIALCIEGKQLASEELAALLDSKATEGYSDICFIIGSSHGLSDRVKKAANQRMSMSKLTFPHQLARVMLFEAVYRAGEINRGTKYHK